MHILFLSLLLNVYIFSSHLPVTTLVLYLFSRTYLNKVLFVFCPVTRNSLIWELCQGRCFFAWKWKKTAFWNMYFLKKLDHAQSPKKEVCVSYFIGAAFCPLCTYDGLTIQAAVFGSTWSGSAVHMRISALNLRKKPHLSLNWILCVKYSWLGVVVCLACV